MYNRLVNRSFNRSEGKFPTSNATHSFRRRRYPSQIPILVPPRRRQPQAHLGRSVFLPLLLLCRGRVMRGRGRRGNHRRRHRAFFRFLRCRFADRYRRRDRLPIRRRQGRGRGGHGRGCFHCRSRRRRPRSSVPEKRPLAVRYARGGGPRAIPRARRRELAFQASFFVAACEVHGRRRRNKTTKRGCEGHVGCDVSAADCDRFGAAPVRFFVVGRPANGFVARRGASQPRLVVPQPRSGPTWVGWTDRPARV